MPNSDDSAGGYRKWLPRPRTSGRVVWAPRSAYAVPWSGPDCRRRGDGLVRDRIPACLEEGHSGAELEGLHPRRRSCRVLSTTSERPAEPEENAPGTGCRISHSEYLHVLTRRRQFINRHLAVADDRSNVRDYIVGPEVDIAALILRILLGSTLVAHGWNHAFGKGGIRGTSKWFESIGMTPGRTCAFFFHGNRSRRGHYVDLGSFNPVRCGWGDRRYDCRIGHQSYQEWVLHIQ
ncbi:DoxX family protein [Rhodococcus opacus]|nr:DoxX family protein [Rhodococcus opacus]